MEGKRPASSSTCDIDNYAYADEPAEMPETPYDDAVEIGDIGDIGDADADPGDPPPLTAEMIQAHEEVDIEQAACMPDQDEQLFQIWMHDRAEGAGDGDAGEDAGDDPRSPALAPTLEVMIAAEQLPVSEMLTGWTTAAVNIYIGCGSATPLALSRPRRQDASRR